jgi:hypothetical protein
MKNISIAILTVFLCISFTSYLVAAEDNPIISRGESFTISATLLTNGTSGTPVANQIVYFYDQSWNNLMASTETDSSGVASIDYSFPLSHPLGNTLVNVTFRGNASLALSPTCQWFTITITSSTTIDVDAPINEYAPNDILEFSIHLTDDNSNPIDSANLTIFSDGISILDICTNETGSAEIMISLDPTNFSLGNHIIEVRYEGDPIRFYRGSLSNFGIEVRRISTSIEIVSLSNNPVMLTQTWDTTLQMLTGEGQLSMEVVHILLDGVFFESVSTDNEGYIRYSLPINQSFSIGEHTLTFEFIGNVRYSEISIEIVIAVGSSINLNITPLNYAEIGRNLSLEVSAVDVYSRPLTSGTIEIIDQSINLTIITPVTNQSTMIIQIPIFGERGPRIFQIELFDGVLLYNNTISLSLDIWTRPIIEIVSSNILGFASPHQTLLLDVKLEDYRGILPEKQIIFFLSNTNETAFITTQMNGLGRIEFQSPNIEGNYILSIMYEGNESDFELSFHREMSFTVSQTIPIEVMLREYEINTPLALIYIRLQIQALNGSYPEGVSLQYNWITTQGSTSSGFSGITELNLPMPSVPGVHTLHYEIGSIRGLQATSGVIYIVITSEDANASQGVGLYGLFIGFVSSLGISVIPIARRRLILG